MAATRLRLSTAAMEARLTTLTADMVGRLTTRTGDMEVRPPTSHTARMGPRRRRRPRCPTACLRCRRGGSPSTTTARGAGTTPSRRRAARSGSGPWATATRGATTHVGTATRGPTTAMVRLPTAGTMPDTAGIMLMLRATMAGVTAVATTEGSITKGRGRRTRKTATRRR